ncbi:MAG: 4-alpha-glucanotransferase, partial [Clostridia bacterium]|nr:4-alpha-glucanotransferase [Clostridia bacterium]
GDAKKRFDKECPHRKGQSRTYDLIELSLASRAALTVVPMQDYLELENAEGRMNTPSVSEGNWTYRLSARYATGRLKTKIKEVNIRTKRVDKCKL